MRRRNFIGLLGSAAAWPVTVHAQRSGKLPIIGFLGTNATVWNPWTAAFVERLRTLGWVEGRTIAIEYRWAEGRTDLAAEIAAEFVRLRVDAIVTNGTAVATVKKATSVIPIVFPMASDPVGRGLIASLARPGGNLTGLMLYDASVASKWLSMLKEIESNLKRAALLINPKSAPYFRYFVNAAEAAAPPLGIEPVFSPIENDAADVERVIESFARIPGGGLVTLPDSTPPASRCKQRASSKRYST